MRGRGPDGEPGAEGLSGGRIEIGGARGTPLSGSDLDAWGIVRELEISKLQIGQIAQAKPRLKTELDEGVIAPGLEGFRRWFRGKAAKLFGMGDRGGRRWWQRKGPEGGRREAGRREAGLGQEAAEAADGDDSAVDRCRFATLGKL